MFSLAGVPPLVGFFGKFYVLMAAVEAGLVWLAVAGVIASVIGAFYYLRIVYLMYFGEAAEPLDGRMPALHWALLAVSALAMVLGVVNLFGVESARRRGGGDARALAMTRWPAGVGREIHAELDSTNAEALRRAAARRGRAALDLARGQTAARGRRGRAWVDAGGELRGDPADPAAGGDRGAARRSWRRSGSSTRWWR